MMEAPRIHAVVLADGAVPPRAVLDAAWPGWDEGVTLVVAADGGVRHAAAFEFAVDRWVGDGDSTAPEDLEALKAAGVAIDRVAVDKDESDTELALLAAVAAGADTVTILGGLGGVRVDHALVEPGPPAARGARTARRAPVRRGGRPALAPRRPGPSRVAGRARALRPGRRPRLAHSARRIGQHVETQGLRYPLGRETLTARSRAGPLERPDRRDRQRLGGIRAGFS